MYVTEDRAEAERMLAEVLSPVLCRRPIEELRVLKMPTLSQECAGRILRAYRDAGAQRVFVWPIADERAQLERFFADVVPLVN